MDPSVLSADWSVGIEVQAKTRENATFDRGKFVGRAVGDPKNTMVSKHNRGWRKLVRNFTPS